MLLHYDRRSLSPRQLVPRLCLRCPFRARTLSFAGAAPLDSQPMDTIGLFMFPDNLASHNREDHLKSLFAVATLAETAATANNASASLRLLLIIFFAFSPSFSPMSYRP